MLKLETKDDLQQLIAENERESLSLEFKAGAAIANEKKGEIGKDVSAMANADGGQIIYGIKERDHVAAEIWPVDSARFNHEWLEKVIRNNVTPPIEGLLIRMIDVGPGPHDVAFVVTIPAAVSQAPHQAKADLKYYRRHNFSADPMADYEIREAMRRVVDPDLFASFDISLDDIVGGYRLRIMPTLNNRSSSPAIYAALTVFADNRLGWTQPHLQFWNQDKNVRGNHPHSFDLQASTVQLAPPLHFPIFRERGSPVHQSVWVYPESLNGKYFGVGYRVAAPGCEREEYFVLRADRFRITSIEKAPGH